MDIFHSVILGIIEGITEFLPISSTAHLVLAERFMNIPTTDFSKSFDIIIQLGAILAVIIIYWQKIFSSWEQIKRIIVAFIPTALIGLALYKIVKNVFLGDVWLTVAMLFIGGIILAVFERFVRKTAPTFHGNNLPTYMQSFWIGVFQAIAVIPGVSRSGATIVGGQLIGVEKKTIVDFSFLLAIPTMLAATGLDLVKSAGSFSMDQFGVLTVGFIVSFVVALIAIKSFLSYIQKRSFAVFGWYRILISIIVAVIILWH